VGVVALRREAPEHLGEMPRIGGHPTLEEDAEAIDAYENEPIIWMAANDYLSETRSPRSRRRRWPRVAAWAPTRSGSDPLGPIWPAGGR
jgi:hypothetical protein